MRKVKDGIKNWPLWRGVCPWRGGGLRENKAKEYVNFFMNSYIPIFDTNLFFH